MTGPRHAAARLHAAATAAAPQRAAGHARACSRSARLQPRPSRDPPRWRRPGQRAFGENYVQEALAKQARAGRAGGLEWHLIGHLQSNKCRDGRCAFDWVQTVDRPSWSCAGPHRRPGPPPLNLLSR
jgi:PLP dependent protein